MELTLIFDIDLDFLNEKDGITRQVGALVGQAGRHYGSGQPHGNLMIPLATGGKVKVGTWKKIESDTHYCEDEA